MASNEPLRITANSTEYLVTIQFVNDKGQTKVIPGQDFKKLTFESSYLTPFMRGRLQLDNKFERSTFQTVAPFKSFDYNMVTSGGEFIYIAVEQVYNPTTNQKVTILSETYIVQNVEIGLNDGQKVLNYFFVNIDYGPLMYTKFPWSTNNYINDATHKSTNDKQILVSDAIKHLLVSLYKRESKPESIIDVNNWEESSSKIEYTLKNQQPAIAGLNYLISKYNSKIDHDMGILTKNKGVYQLTSLGKLIKQASLRNYAGLIRIETEDNRQSYSNTKQTNKPGMPAHISKINIIPQKTTVEVDTVIDHSVSSYNFSNKEFNLFNEEGTVNKLKQDILNYANFNLSRLGATIKEAAVNQEPSSLNKSNRVILTAFENEQTQTNYTGRLVLQQKFINCSKKITIPLLGNLYLKGSNFVNLELTGIPFNREMRDISGLWFILQNTTVLRPGVFTSKVICGKLDREKE